MAALVRALHAFDELDIVPFSDRRVADLLPTLSPDERMASVHIRHVDGRIDSAGMATIDLASRLPLVGGLARTGAPNRPFQRSTEAAYQIVARNRHHLGRLVRDADPVLRWRTDR